MRRNYFERQGRFRLARGDMFIVRVHKTAGALGAEFVLGGRSYKHLAPPERKSGLPRVGLANTSMEIPPNLSANPFSHRHRHTIPNHSIGIVVTSHKTERVRHSLQSRDFSNRVWPNATRESPVDD